MNLPRQVKEQNERAEQLAQQFQQPEQQPQGDPPGETVDPPLTDPPPNDPPPAAPDSERKEREDWKAKYHVLQGKYNAEIPRYAAELRTLRDRLGVLEQANAELQQKQAVTPPEPDPGVERLRQEYGDGVVETIERLADQKVSDRLKPLQQKIDETEAERQKRIAQEEYDSRAVSFAEAINELVPDWETIDKLPAFHVFLSEPGVDGRSRQESLMDAAKSFDAAGAARIFAQFKRTDAFKATQQEPKPTPTTQEALGRQIAPEPTGRDRQMPTQGRVWSRADIKAAYHAIAMGEYRNDPDKAKALEQEIETALREGRVGK